MSETDKTTTDRTDSMTNGNEAPDAPRQPADDGAVGETGRKGEEAERVHGDPAVRYHTEPLLTPTLALMGTVVLLALVAIGYVWNDPAAVGGPELAELVINGVVILGVLLLIRLGMTLLVLWRTHYTVHDDGFRTEYELAYHSKSREIPVEELRGQERERGRFETLFDCATLRLLTGGTDSSLGFIEFVHVPDPDVASERIAEVRRRHEGADE